MKLFIYFLLNVKASMLSTGGLGNVPSLHADLVRRGFATDKQFAAALAVGQLSPGPNGLWVIALGFVLGGIPGALLSMLAISIPAGLVLIVRKLYQSHKDHVVVDSFIWGLSLAIIAEFVWILVGLIRNEKPLLFSIIIALSSLYLSLRTKLPVVVIMVGAAVIGLIYKP